MKGQKWANLSAITGILGGAAAIGGGLYAHSAEPLFGIPQFFGIYSQYLSGVHVLIGIGVIMVIGGLLSFKWPSVGAIIVCVAAMAGLVYTFNRGQYRWTPLSLLLGRPVGARLAQRHLRRLCGLPERPAEQREARRRPLAGTSRSSDALRSSPDAERPGRRAGATRAFPSLARRRRGVDARVVQVATPSGLQLRLPHASRRIVTGPSLTRSTCMCAPNTPVSTGTPSSRSACT